MPQLRSIRLVQSSVVLQRLQPTTLQDEERTALGRHSLRAREGQHSSTLIIY